MKFIESADNPKFKLWKSLLQSKGIKKEGLFLVFGPKLIQEVIQQYPSSCVSLILSPKSKEEPTHYRFLPGQVIRFVLKPELYRELDLLGTNEDLLVCQLPDITHADLSQAPQGLEVLIPASDPSNLGAILRSAQAFGVNKIILLQEAAHPFHPRSIRAAASGLMNLKIYWGPSLRQIDQVRDLWALDADGEDISKFQWPRNLRLLVGMEGPGIPQEFPKSKRLSIAMAPQSESLNVAVAASIAMWSFSTLR